MTRRRPDNRDERNIPAPRLDEPSAIRGAGMPSSGNEPTGIVGDASASAGSSRSGVDTRRRGWFWHWNSIVTQFAPIIGLKGVGLLNSYTVWTDRREESPNRGFAFPSQQSEADFYGEDRNELITINKILVALDLIEIKKQMVNRTDAKGRRWKVPHNLYRVKDHGDDFNLTVEGVRKVVELANKDRAVYRYVRRIFSSRFAPIDRDNVWHSILEEMADDPTWQKLAARTAKDEKRASERTKAGHASRRATTTEVAGDFSLPDSGDTATEEVTAPDSSIDSAGGDTNDSDSVPETSAANSNNGLATDVAHTNIGSDEKPASTDALANNGGPTSVDPGSTTYYQELTTTTTGDSNESMQIADHGFGPGAAPDEQRDRDMTVRLFDEANGRVSTTAARRQLERIAERFAELAVVSGNSSWELVGNAIDEAVASGSAFVAPKRIREILTRWERDGVPEMYAREAQSGAGSSRPVTSPVTGTAGASHSLDREIGGESQLPVDREPAEVWGAACSLMRGSLSAVAIGQLRAGASITGYASGVVFLSATSVELADAIAGDWLDVIQRKLAVVLRRPVRVEVSAPDDRDPERAGVPAERDTVGSRESRPAAVSRPQGATVRRGSTHREPARVPVFTVRECGMTSTQVWMMVIDDLRASGAIPRPEVDAWLRDSVLLGRDEDDALIVGVPHALAERRAARFRDAIETATMHIVGFDCAIRVVRTQTWLAAHEDGTGTDG